MATSLDKNGFPEMGVPKNGLDFSAFGCSAVWQRKRQPATREIPTKVYPKSEWLIMDNHTKMELGSEVPSQDVFESVGYQMALVYTII